jgi:hypothetical protein
MYVCDRREERKLLILLRLLISNGCDDDGDDDDDGDVHRESLERGHTLEAMTMIAQHTKTSERMRPWLSSLVDEATGKLCPSKSQ